MWVFLRFGETWLIFNINFSQSSNFCICSGISKAMSITDISNLNNNKQFIVWPYVLLHTYERPVYKVELWVIWLNQTWISMLNKTKLLGPYGNKYLNYFWVIRYLDARHVFSKYIPCDLLSSPVAESLYKFQWSSLVPSFLPATWIMVQSGA